MRLDCLASNFLEFSTLYDKTDKIQINLEINLKKKISSITNEGIFNFYKQFSSVHFPIIKRMLNHY